MLDNFENSIKYMKNSLLLLGFVVLFTTMADRSYASEPLVVDSRIRTLIYNENEVYRLITDYGYQSNIVFSEKERVRTLSIGDSVPFKITPSGNRIFVKTLQRGHLTNMTIVTNKRVYQFELSSIIKSARDITYVMRFFYPQEDLEAIADEDIENISEIVVDEFDDGSSPSIPRSENISEVAKQPSLSEKDFNYSYSISGPDGDFDFSPSQIFDNGNSTFMKFAPETANIVNLFEVTKDGIEQPLAVRFEGEYLVIDKALGKIAVRLGSDIICVYNDSVVEN